VSDGYIGGTGEVVELSIKVGDSVLINNGSGQKLKLQGDEYHLVRESEILMIL
jgi:co-chaperonin GroES (HSP10)